MVLPPQGRVEALIAELVLHYQVIGLTLVVLFLLI